MAFVEERSIALAMLAGFLPGENWPPRDVAANQKLVKFQRIAPEPNIGSNPGFSFLRKQ